MRVIGHIWIVMVLLAASCNVAAPVPSPTSSAAPTPFASPGGIDTPVPPVATSSPFVRVTEPPPTDSEPTPTATPTEPPTDPPSSEIWRGVPDFPPPGAHISAVLVGGPGFVAIGYHGDDEYPCDPLTVDGRVWTSADGEHWDESDPEALDELFLTRAVNADGTIYAFGLVGDPDCAQDEVRAVARSTDGIIWERLQPDLPASFWMSAVGTIGPTLIALGEDTAWTSADGVHWQRAGDVPFSYSWFDEIASLGDTAVVFKGNALEPVWVSVDGAESWRLADFEPLYNLDVLDATVGGDLIVLVGAACCSLPNTKTGLSVTSTDGRQWRESAPFRDVPQAVVAVSDGYVALGRNTWVSRDGLDWHVAPRLPEVDERSEMAAASAEVGVFVINGELAWFAPAAALSPGGSSEAPRNAEVPEIEVRYQAEVFLHCGWPPIYFGLKTWLPDPPFEDNSNPPPGFGDQDRGWLTQLDENELLYESRRGQTVNLRPSPEAEASGPCA